MAGITFPETRWSRILRARDEAHEEALEHVVRAYRTPIQAYLRYRGMSMEDSEDLLQEVFIQLCDGEVLRRADRSKGRFRTLLLKIAKHMIGNHVRRETATKRGGGAVRVPLDDLFAGTPDEKDDDFNREWSKNIVRRALDKLKEECRIRDKPHFDILHLNLREELSYPRIAEKMGLTESNVAYHMRHARARLKRLVAEEVADYCSSSREYHEELRALSAWLFP